MGTGFSFQSTDLLIIDESDSLIFKDPEAFNVVLSKCRSICLTATPDDNDQKGAEKKILRALDLKKY